ncbi:hypothetical protein D9M71_739380 [compost metagenome]
MTRRDILASHRHAFSRGPLLDFENHAEPVQADVIVAGDGDRIAIEARILAQLRGPRLQRADDTVMALPDRHQKDRQGHAKHPLRPARLGEPSQAL